jgi:hypothetical protein
MLIDKSGWGAYRDDYGTLAQVQRTQLFQNSAILNAQTKRRGLMLFRVGVGGIAALIGP